MDQAPRTHQIETGESLSSTANVIGISIQVLSVATAVLTLKIVSASRRLVHYQLGSGQDLVGVHVACEKVESELIRRCAPRRYVARSIARCRCRELMNWRDDDSTRGTHDRGIYTSSPSETHRSEDVMNVEGLPHFAVRAILKRGPRGSS
jgi:hypothetical protein